MREMQQGTARAVQSCIECYTGKRMTAEDLISFIRSIAMHSPTLTALFAPKPAVADSDMGESASADDFAALMALSGQPAPAPQRDMPLTHAAPPPQPAASNPMPSICIENLRAPATKLVVQRTRKAKLSEPSDEELRLMKWWSEKRVPEIARRQHETAGCNMLRSDAEKNSAYVRFLMGKLMKTLPTAGGLKLLQIVRTFNNNSDIEAFSESIKELVDEFEVKVNLTHAPECTVRAAPAPRGRAAVSRAAAIEAALPSIDLDCDLGAPTEDLSWPSVSAAPTHSHGDGCCGGSSLVGKRKRTETLNGAHPEDDDEGASCPVCKDEPREDDRWVKCDGCGSWYHQICVLFNEIAHGKSVRFFCRTPGCRKRGSRQLNRRQRKPCYPTSPSIESSALADEMMQLVQPVARSDRDVVIKMVANVESVRELKGSRSCRKTVERVRTKTICAFQHTLIGSDLLFLIMFVEEIVGPDGVGRVEIKKVDNNGFYEEARHKESIDVEKAIVEAYLSRSAAAGFASALFHIDGLKRSLFLGAPPSPFLSSTSSLAHCLELLREASAARIVHGFEEESTEHGETFVRAQLIPAGMAPRAVAQERDADIACPVAQTAQDWVQVQKQHGYMFEDLQFAKFSSMMLVYHLIKGWRKEFSAPVRQAAADYDSDDSTDVTPPPSRSQASARAAFVGADEALTAPYYHSAAPGQQTMTPAGNYGEPRGQMSDGAGLHCMTFPMDSLPEAEGRGIVGDGSGVPNSMNFRMDSLPHDVRLMLEAPVESIRETARYADAQVPPPPPASPPLRQQTFSGLQSGPNDAFWSDSLFQHEAESSVQDESPYWDCFFNTL